MNKFKTGLLILFAIIIVILIIFLVKNINNNNENQENKKIISEIKFMDTKLTALLNSINNISVENYKVSVTKTSTNTSSNSGGGTDSTSESSSDSSSNSKSGSTSEGGTGSSDKSSNTTDEQYDLKEEGILTGNNEIDWDNLKNEIELLYSMVPTMTLDLYSINVNQEEILGFNKELDELTMIVKNEDKEKTLIKLADLYRYLPVYASNSSNDVEFISFIETKLNVIKTYVYVNLNNWDEAKNNIKKAIENYTNVLNNINNKSNSYDTNKIYVILNELDSSVDIQDMDVFLIKYKTFLEETEKYK